MSKTKGEETFCVRGFDGRQPRRQTERPYGIFFAVLLRSHPRTCLLRPLGSPRTSRTQAATPWRYSPTSAVRIRSVCALIGLITCGGFQAHAVGRKVVIDGHLSTSLLPVTSLRRRRCSEVTLTRCKRHRGRSAGR